jgi:hypothetical protein
VVRSVLLFVAMAAVESNFEPTVFFQDEKTEAKDPLQSFEPKSKPGAGQKLLEKFAGDWDVVKSFHPRKGEPVRVTGECKQTMIHGGRFLQSEFAFSAQTGKTSGLGLIGFEPETGKFTSVWTDSRQTRLSLRQSEDTFNGEEIVLYGKEIGGKEVRRSKTVTRLELDGKRIVHRQYAVETGAADRLVMELVMTRKEK